jgi:hypothetical protein
VTSYQLSGIATSAPSAYSTVAVTGTVTLSSPADSSATVSLTSSNSAVVSVPPTVTVPATGAAASFPLTLTSVAADTPVTITATIGGVSKVASFTVLKPADSVQVAKAQDVVSKAQLRVDATSTNTAATITVWNAGTKAFIGTLANNGGGKYGGTFLISPAVLSITLKSSLGGTVTAPVDQK